MKQLSLFSTKSSGSSDSMESREGTPNQPVFSLWKIFVDGAARNNPGPAGAGVYMLRDELVAATYGVFLGKKTNNEAEYLALLLALFEVRSMLKQGDLVTVISDSQLLVRQVSGAYRVKEPRLQQLHMLVKKLLHGINYSVVHVLRENNTHADALANEGIDTKKAAPAHFIKFLQDYALYL